MTRWLTGILVFPDVEVLDFCGPFEVLSTTRLTEPRKREDESPFDVRLVAEAGCPLRATGGLRVIPDHTFADAPQFDLLVVPGGWGTREEINNPRLIEWVRRQAAGAKLVASVCTGSFLSTKAGLLAGRRATTHWKSLDRMRDAFPDVTVDCHSHVVEDGTIFTSAGISAGIDLALRVVARVCGESVARGTAAHMEYPYPDGNARRVPT